MTRDEIISMAREAGYGIQNTVIDGVRIQQIWGGYFETENAIRFATLVAARERKMCALICDAEGREWDSDAVVTLKNYAEHCAAAIRARADNEPNRLPSHRCSSLCSPDETFCAITKDGKCDATDRSCDAAIRADNEVTK